jgi:hypothetical protein
MQEYWVSILLGKSAVGFRLLASIDDPNVRGT